VSSAAKSWRRGSRIQQLGYVRSCVSHLSIDFVLRLRQVAGLHRRATLLRTPKQQGATRICILGAPAAPAGKATRTRHIPAPRTGRRHFAMYRRRHTRKQSPSSLYQEDVGPDVVFPARHGSDPRQVSPQRSQLMLTALVASGSSSLPTLQPGGAAHVTQRCPLQVNTGAGIVASPSRVLCANPRLVCYI